MWVDSLAARSRKLRPLFSENCIWKDHLNETSGIIKSHDRNIHSEKPRMPTISGSKNDTFFEVKKERGREKEHSHPGRAAG
jgi:hypothetical protein